MQGQVIVIIVLVFMMIGQVIIFLKNIDQRFKIVIPGHIYFGNITATHAKIQVNIVSQLFQLFLRFISGNYSYRGTVTPDNMRNLPK